MKPLHKIAIFPEAILFDFSVLWFHEKCDSN